MITRDETIKGVQTRGRYPVVIAGGGINGIGAFRDLSAQGVDCLLVEKGDFCSGASGASSRMIHGGLKYLESGELKLVAESVTERNLLLKNAPHAVRPAEFVILNRSWSGGAIHAITRFFGGTAPIGGRGAFVTAFGLFAYDVLGMRNKGTPRSGLRSRSSVLSKFKGIKDNFVAASSYYDCLIEYPERLGVELVLDGLADNPGSAALNHTKIISLADNKLRLRDELTGSEWDIEPSIMINAGGAWIDDINSRAGLASKMIAGTKGSHIVVDNPTLASTLGNTILCFEAPDGRECFAYVLFDRVVIGSTDIVTEDLDCVRCTSSEVRYLLAALQETFPSLELSERQIVYTYCGVRPLGHAEVKDPGDLSRNHSIRLIEPNAGRRFPIVSLVGGKWTTYRSFAAQAADLVLGRLGKKRSQTTKTRAIGGGIQLDKYARASLQREVAAMLGGEPELARNLVQRYGCRAKDVAAYCKLHGQEPLSSDSSHMISEIAFIARNECAQRVADVLKRRTSLAVRGIHSLDAIGEIATIMGRTLAWDTEKTRREIFLARQEIERVNLPEQRYG